MKHTTSLFTALAVLVVAGPSLAQPMPSSPSGGTPPYGYTPPPGTPVTPDNQGRQGAVPPVGQQIQAARSLGNADANRQPANLLRQADRALRQRKVAVANELLERAQTASLNGNGAADASTNSMASAIGAARQAVVNGDMAQAHQRIAEALGTAPSDAMPASTAHRRRQQH